MPTRPDKRGGLWHQPQWLNLVSDGLFLFAFAVLGWALMSWTLFSKPLFPLRELVLNAPPAHVTQAQLEYVARTAIRGNFFTARIEEIRLAFEKLPWVQRAEVRRIWPDVLELSLEEYQAVAYWKNTGDGGGDVRLVSQQGDVFAASSDIKMPEFSGPQGSAPAVLERYEAFSKILSPTGAKLVRLELSPRGAWRLWTDSGLSIVLDSGQECPSLNVRLDSGKECPPLGIEQKRPSLDVRLEDFVAAWPGLQKRLGANIALADLRYQNGYALTPGSKNNAADSGETGQINRK
jgi:cell division protein FtsQ